MTNTVISCMLIFGFLVSCSSTKSPEKLEEEHTQWQKTRLDRLKSPTGWLNLAGLYWLKPGKNNLGSDTTNLVIFPEKAPAFIGVLELEEGQVIFENKLGEALKVNDSLVTRKPLLADDSGNPDKVEHGDFEWYIIKRGDQYGIRLRDYQSELIHTLDSIPSYPYSTEWRIFADFVPLDTPLVVTVPTVIGVDEEYTVNGMLEFEVNGKKQTLFPFEAGDNYFLIFGDETSALETYGAGRFLYTDKPNWKKHVLIDFNRAYNPPCAFTPYATCPLPPRENILDVAIRAGEKDVHVYEH